MSEKTENARVDKKPFGGRLAIILIVVGCLLLLSDAGVIGYNLYDDSRAGQSVSGAMEKLNAAIPLPPLPGVKPDYELDPHRDMPVVEIDGYRYIGKISVPSLELELPVMEEWNYPRLKIAPCRYIGTAYLPNFVICAHNYTSHFGRLKNLVQGDAVDFTDMDGNVFHYAVDKVEILIPTAVEEMQTSGYDLSLFTCTIGGRTRVTVRCKKIPSEPSFADA